jgi:Tfp pilus assembly protein PilE
MNMQKGIALVEALSIVIVAAIIVLIAVPAYERYEREAKLQEAFSTLIKLHSKEDMYWASRHSYGSSDCAIGMLAANTAHFMYTCSIEKDRKGYRITANGQEELLNYNFTIDQTGSMVTTSFPGAKKLPVSCWLEAAGTCA